MGHSHDFLDSIGNLRGGGQALRSDRVLQVAGTVDRCEVLGPGSRFVIWVQGCPLRCAGCVAPETLPFDGGEAVPVADLAERILATPQLDGVTFSGGEPFAQAEALAHLVDLVREARDISVMSYSGYALRWLERRGSAGQLGLLRRLDILVDGPYRRELHDALLWRGSSNQRIHLLTSRHASLAAVPDVSAGLQVLVGSEGLRWLGVPPTVGFREALEQRLAEAGIVVRVGEEASRE